jgi:hypothetical protein
LTGPLVVHRYDPVFEDARPQPFLDQADDAFVADPMFQEANKPFPTYTSGLVGNRSQAEGTIAIGMEASGDQDARQRERILPQL